MLWGTADPRVDAGTERERASERKYITDLFRATSGSAGLDLCSTTDIVLTPEMGMQALPAGIFGPLPPGTVGLLLGRSSTTMKGIQVSPGVIDEDFTGEIKIMTHSPLNILNIPAGTCIAQLIIFPRKVLLLHLRKCREVSLILTWDFSCLLNISPHKK